MSFNFYASFTDRELEILQMRAGFFGLDEIYEAVSKEMMRRLEE